VTIPKNTSQNKSAFSVSQTYICMIYKDVDCSGEQ
jgi:hypothetical protein